MCVFCDISARRTTADIVFEDELSLAFLDARPVFVGHTLLVPRDHYETLHDLPVEIVTPLFSNARMLSSAVQTALGADGTFIAINNRVSQSIPHLHIHVVPRRFKDGLRGFFWPRRKYASDDERRDIAESIRASIVSVT